MRVLLEKRLITMVCIIAALFMVIFSLQAALASEGVNLSAESKSVEVGDTVTININIANAAETEGGQFDLTYNPDVVKVTNIERGQFVSSADDDKFMSNEEFSDNRLRVIWITPNADTDTSGIVCSISFEVIDTGVSDLTFSEVTMAPAEIAVGLTTSGRITVEEDVSSYNLTLKAEPSAGGTISVGGQYPAGEEIEISASANTGFTFKYWEKDDNQTRDEESFTFTMPERNVTWTAKFEADFDGYELTLLAYPAQAGRVSGAGVYQEGETVRVCVEELDKSRFSFGGWKYKDGDLVTGDQEARCIDFVMPDNNVILVAGFSTPSTGGTPLAFIGGALLVGAGLTLAKVRKRCS